MPAEKNRISSAWNKRSQFIHLTFCGKETQKKLNRCSTVCRCSFVNEKYKTLFTKFIFYWFIHAIVFFFTFSSFLIFYPGFLWTLCFYLLVFNNIRYGPIVANHNTPTSFNNKCVMNETTAVTQKHKYHQHTLVHSERPYGTDDNIGKNKKQTKNRTLTT